VADLIRCCSEIYLETALERPRRCARCPGPARPETFDAAFVPDRPGVSAPAASSVQNSDSMAFEPIPRPPHTESPITYVDPTQILSQSTPRLGSSQGDLHQALRCAKGGRRDRALEQPPCGSERERSSSWSGARTGNAPTWQTNGESETIVPAAFAPLVALLVAPVSASADRVERDLRAADVKKPGLGRVFVVQGCPSAASRAGGQQTRSPIRDALPIRRQRARVHATPRHSYPDDAGELRRAHARHPEQRDA